MFVGQGGCLSEIGWVGLVSLVGRGLCYHLGEVNIVNGLIETQRLRFGDLLPLLG